MEKSTQVISSMIKDKIQDYLSGVMVVNMKVSGTKENSMDMENF